MDEGTYAALDDEFAEFTPADPIFTCFDLRKRIARRAASRVQSRPHSELGLHFPTPHDALPSLQDVVTTLNTIKTIRADLFEFTAEDIASCNMRPVELGHAAIKAAIFVHLQGVTYSDMFFILLQRWRHRPQLVGTIQALESILSRVNAHGDNPATLMWEERMCFFRQHADDEFGNYDNIIHSVSYKIVQLTFLLCFVVSDLRLKAIMQPPPPEIVNKTVVEESSRVPLREFLTDDEEPQGALFPLHPDWFAHNVPLLETPIFSRIHARCTKNLEAQQHAYAAQMAFLRTLLTAMLGILKVQLSQARGVQTFLIGALTGGAAVKMVSFLRKSSTTFTAIAAALFFVLLLSMVTCFFWHGGRLLHCWKACRLKFVAALLSDGNHNTMTAEEDVGCCGCCGCCGRRAVLRGNS